jgi:hypothetical protein
MTTPHSHSLVDVQTRPILTPASVLEPTKSSSRKKRKQPDRSAPAVQAAPEIARNMTSEERRNLKRVITASATSLQEGWLELSLPVFSPPDGLEMVAFFRLFWDWQDRCMEIMKTFRDTARTEYDYSPFEQAFGNLHRLRSLYGREASDCAQALREHVASRNSSP